VAVVMKNVFSSNVAAIGYDAESSALIVRWRRGKVSEYLGVPANVANEAMNAPSIGLALQATIKGQYPHRYI
jgi:hypothetical protein